MGPQTGLREIDIRWEDICWSDAERISLILILVIYNYSFFKYLPPPSPSSSPLLVDTLPFPSPLAAASATAALMTLFVSYKMYHIALASILLRMSSRCLLGFPRVTTSVLKSISVLLPPISILRGGGYGGQCCLCPISNHRRCLHH